ncbi:MAG: Rrf2 family transcriptional regulator [Desulfosarcinaceae bacterium]|jgi:Rrf2 family protein
MKLSTRSRYGTRLMVDLAEHYAQGPVQIRDIAKRQSISVKYLEQLIIPLKKAGFITSVRGPKGGHLLSKPPASITTGEIVRVLEKETGLVQCLDSPEICERLEGCPTRNLWKRATQAFYDQLDGVTLANLVQDEEKR